MPRLPGFLGFGMEEGEREGMRRRRKAEPSGGKKMETFTCVVTQCIISSSFKVRRAGACHLGQVTQEMEPGLSPDLSPRPQVNLLQPPAIPTKMNLTGQEDSEN